MASNRLRFPAGLAAMGMVLTLFSPAGASTWGGNNGVITLSFTSGEQLQSMLYSEADHEGPLIVDVYGVLTKVDPVKYQGENFLSLGGFEMMLLVEGAEATIISGEIVGRGFDVRPSAAQFQVGFAQSLELEEGGTVLAHWQVLFAEAPGPVVFRLDPAGALSCSGAPDCNADDTWAIYTGPDENGQNMVLFGAGYRPAFLNWEVVGEHTWRDVGVCQAIEVEQE